MSSNLFTGYLAVKDRAFVVYIEKNLELYEERTVITPNQLMLWARQKYDLLRDKGVWNDPTPEEEKTIALTAQVKKISEKTEAWKTSQMQVLDFNSQGKHKEPEAKTRVVRQRSY